jgi:multidrug/hemolysin transport system permease protein
MVQDKANGTVKDLRISPVRPSILSLSYYLATLISTLIICLVAAGICLGYVAIVGWYMTVTDVLCLLLDILLLVLFGTALSSIINFFLSTQGQISAVGTVVSSGYGFICGAYMPISSFGDGLQKVISFLPGTYGTALVRNHAMQSALAELEKQGIPASAVEGMRDGLDCNLYFFGNRVEPVVMYLILAASAVLLVGIYVLMNALKKADK